MRARPWLSGAAALVVVAFAAHHQVLGEWWSEDDPAILLHAKTTSPLEVLTSPNAYRALSLSSYTPLVTISFDADLAIAGMKPSFFYLHQILAVAAASVIMFVLLCRVATPRASLAAWLAAAGFVISPLGTYAARSLMIRHYAEGLLFSLLALLLDGIRSESKGGRAAVIAGGAACYAVALSAKEIYGPLPLLLIWQRRVRGDSWKITLAGMIPYGLVAILYAAWRSHMLGSFGGYAGGQHPASLLLGAFSGVAEIMTAAVMPDGSVPGALLCVLALAIGGIVAKPRAAWSYLIIAAFIAFLPLAGAAADPQVRYAFIPIALLFAGAGMAAAVAPHRTVVAILAILTVVSGFAGWTYGQRLSRGRQAQYAEGRYVWKARHDAATLWGSASSWYLGGLEQIRQLEGRGPSPRYVLSPEGVVIAGLDPELLAASRHGESEIRRLNRRQLSTLARLRESYSAEQPLRVRIEHMDGVVRWSAEPQEGNFAWLVVPSLYRLEIDREGSRRIAGSEPFRIIRTLPGGRWTVTPQLDIPPEGDSITWKQGR